MSRLSRNNIGLLLGVLICFGVPSLFWPRSVNLLTHYSSTGLFPRPHDDCNLTAFTDQIRFKDGSSNDVIPRHHVALCSKFVYNRVPKCASRTMKDIFETLSEHNNFTTIFIDRQYVINSAEEIKYKHYMRSVSNQRFVLVSHHYHHDFSKYFNRTLVYINIVREPNDWFDSVFNFHKHNPRKFAWWEKQEINACIRDERCFERVRKGWGPLKFLCGSAQLCNRNSAAAVQQAKTNVESRYLVVGLIEELSGFTEVLEYLIPNMFTGLTNTFIDQRSVLKNQTMSRKFDKLEQSTSEILRQKMKHETELYHFLSQRFHNMMDAVRRLKDRSSAKTNGLFKYLVW